MPNQYIFILGRNQELSLAEIEAVLNTNQVKFELVTRVEDAALIACDKELNLETYQNQLGGTIKIAKVLKSVTANDLTSNLITIIQEMFIKTASGRFQFGFSSFGQIKANDLQRLGLQIKKQLAGSNRPVRFIVSKEKNLSSVIVWKEKLLNSGLDLIVLPVKQQIFLAQTITCQDFRDYAARDFPRPNRDELSGMLPPKLAKIMLNLGGLKPNQIVYDPFCGSGTILQEVLMLGAGSIYGSDISAKAVQDTQNNLKWLETKNNLNPTKQVIFLADATDAKQIKPAGEVDLICTEPYLGPSKNKFFTPQQYKDLALELRELYLKALTNFKPVIKANGVIVMIWPEISDQPTFSLDEVRALGFKIVDSKLTSSDLIYSRPGQIVKRRVVVLVKN